MEYPVQRQLGGHDVGGDSGQVRQQPLDAEPSLLRFGDAVLNIVEVPVVDINTAVARAQPGTAVEYSAAPPANRKDLPGPAQRAEAGRIKAGAAVIHREIPVTIRPADPAAREPPRVTA